MKLNKIKIARLSDSQAKSINGGGTGESTQKNFTCCWCSSGETSFHCPTASNQSDPACNGTKPVSPGF
ncbi:hypothetical protein [Flavobacterium sp. ABG]|uniref:hypothetical protein n=1 Tax=Flavobacterium sp. ABG TaxID=1423322 RepID=UPI00064B1593|nr:hypothetical protein AB674_08795 [Flavobacterium sp. ABG]